MSAATRQPADPPEWRPKTVMTITLRRNGRVLVREQIEREATA